VIRNFRLLLLIILVPVASFAQEKVKAPPREIPLKEQQKMDKMAIIKIPSGASFYIAPIEERPNNYSILLTDANNRTVADSFLASQIQIFEAVMVEAEKFAKTGEAAGTVDAPKITRFVDKKEPSFVIDVEKAGLQSRFYVTINCLNGKLTVDAGAIKRDGKEHQTLFSKILSRIQALNAAPQTQQ
jgi:hypothetical protein